MARIQNATVGAPLVAPGEEENRADAKPASTILLATNQSSSLMEIMRSKRDPR